MENLPNKANHGRFFEDFTVGQIIHHAVPRTLESGDSALYNALYNDRHALYTSRIAAQNCGLGCSPLHDLIVFHTVFGKTVPDLSLNAIANLGYANGRFLEPVFHGDTLRAESRVIGIKENSNRKSGIVWVVTTGYNQHDQKVLEYTRWVMIRKRDPESNKPEPSIPKLVPYVGAARLPKMQSVNFTQFNNMWSGESYRVQDYKLGEIIDHVDSVTIEEAEHMIATRMWQNTARVHFDATKRADGKRLIYGGHIISLARALSCNGLANALMIIAINSGTHVNPCYAGDTIRAWSEILDFADHPAPGASAIRIRTIASKGKSKKLHNPDGKYSESIILDFDYWCLMPN